MNKYRIVENELGNYQVQQYMLGNWLSCAKHSRWSHSRMWYSLGVALELKEELERVHTIRDKMNSIKRVVE